MDIRTAPSYGEHQHLIGTKHPRSTHPSLGLPIVIEYGQSPALGVAGRLLAALGCEVAWVDSEPAGTWQAQPGLLEHLHYGKRRLTPAEAAAIHGALILTDRTADDWTLTSNGELFAHASNVVRLSGAPTADWYVRSGMASLLRGSDPNDELKQLPTHVADAAVGSALAGCAATAIFSDAAGQSVGREARVSYLECGMYLIQQQAAIMQASPLGKDLYGGGTGWSRDTLKNAWPVPAGAAFQTKDGYWIQNLGVDTATHLPILLAALSGSKLRIAIRAPLAVAMALWRLVSRANKLEVIRAVTETVNGVVYGALESMTLAEFKQWSESSGWNFWAKINTVHEARDDRNTLALGCLMQTEGGMVGRAPINFRPHHLEAKL